MGLSLPEGLLSTFWFCSDIIATVGRVVGHHLTGEPQHANAPSEWAMCPLVAKHKPALPELKSNDKPLKAQPD